MLMLTYCMDRAASASSKLRQRTGYGAGQGGSLPARPPRRPTLPLLLWLLRRSWWNLFRRV